MRIYVAGPYSANDHETIMDNVNRAIDAGTALMEIGHDPYIPHLSHYIDERNKLHYEQYMRCGLAWLEVCDAMLFLDHSPGADRELQFAIEHSITVYYSLKEVPDG